MFRLRLAGPAQPERLNREIRYQADLVAMDGLLDFLLNCGTVPGIVNGSPPLIMMPPLPGGPRPPG